LRAASALNLRFQLLLALPPALLVWNAAPSLHAEGGLCSTRLYVVNVLLFWVIAFQLALCAFWLRRRRGWTPVLLATAGALSMWGACDLMVLFLARQSSGPGGALCLSHRNWHRSAVRSNELGFWDDAVGPARIVALGDSFTWGQGVRKEQRFSEQLGRALGTRVANFGRPGSGTNEQLQDMLPRVRSSQPELVLICYLANDIGDRLKLFEARGYEPQPSTRRMLRASPTFNWIYWRFGRAWSDPGEGQRYCFSLLANYLDQHAMAAHRHEISRLADEVRALGARPVAVVLPFPHLFEGVRAQHRENIYRQIVHAFRDAGVATIELQDLEHQFPVGRFEVNPIDPHPSPAVHLAIAQGIENWLRAHPQSWSAPAAVNR
jgi:lysophospholipase L1-like esterase